MGKKQAQNKKNASAHHVGKSKHLYEGTIEITRSGMGYVSVKELHRDILIRPQDLNTALHGDTVAVEIIKESRTGRTEGSIKKIIERKQVAFIGHVHLQGKHCFVIPMSDRPMPDLYIAADKRHGAQHGDKVVVKMVGWSDHRKGPEGEVVEVIDGEDANELAMKQIILENGFPLSFDDDVLEEAVRFPEGIATHELKKRRDMRDVLTFTIDPVDAKDFDDAISISKGSNGLYEIGVHIADVSYFVTPDSALDKAAYERATSVYLPDRVVPMLPERLSNELCSLRPKEDKYTFSAIFKMSSKGQIKEVWLGRTIIHSNHRFTYEEVQEIIESGEGLYSEEILLLNKIAQKLRKERFKKGAINFSSQEVRFVLDEKKKPIGIVIKESKEAHQLIEEFMLLANKHVASFVSRFSVKDKPVTFPYRIHDTPDEEKLKPFMQFARKYGHHFDTSTPENIAASFNRMLKDAQGKPEQHVLEQLGIRTMAKAIYTTENIGHYGLGFTHYCHFTSPIRRYPDILAHRVLQQCLDNAPVLDKKMEAKCRHCSERERAAMESERAANKYKQVEYMANFLGEEFEGVVSGVASFGFWAETIEHKCEGLVSLLSLIDYDEFRLLEEDYCLVGKRSGKTIRMGDKVMIRVVAANLEKRQLDYELVLTDAKRDEKKHTTAKQKRHKLKKKK